VVHGNSSLLGRMPGDDWQRFANLRALLAYQWLFPGKKLLFMGGELGQSAVWDANGQLDWWLLEHGPYHRGLQRFVGDLNRLYVGEPALWEADYDVDGFFWVDCSDHESRVLSFVRHAKDQSRHLLVVLNLTPVPHAGYRVGLPRPGFWREALNSDAELYGGSNWGNLGGVTAEAYQVHHQPYSAPLTLPPLSLVAFTYQG
jgi:1,4-alpha-glucan branching enzyme